MKGTVASRFHANLDGIQRLLEDSGAILGYLFGSAAKKVEREDSDLDIAVLLSDKLPKERYGDIRLRFTTELIGLTHTNDVDVVILNEAPPLLAHQVISSGQLFLGTRLNQVRFEFRAIQRYIDTIPLREITAAGFMTRIRQRKPMGQENKGQW